MMNMVPLLISIYVIVPVLVVLGVRKYKEYQWGKCESSSSLQGKVFLVTGANSGIGKETVRALVKRKARVIMACRDLNSARETIEEIRKNVSSGELIPMHLDLASLDSVRKFATDVLKDFPQIHVLINNAGISLPPYAKGKTSDGFEIHFGVNHLGHFLLTNLLLPRLNDSTPSRIVNVTSILHEKGKIDFDNLQGEKGFPPSGMVNCAYCNSKLANVLFTLELAKRTKGTGVDVFAVCPGFAYTRLFRHSKLKLYQYLLFIPIGAMFMRTAYQASQTVLQCATAESLEGHTGGVYKDCAPYTCKANVDPAVASRLWEVSEKLVGLHTTAN